MIKVKLGDICKIYAGTGFPVQYQGEKNGEYPFYKVGDISRNVENGNIYLQECNNYISSETVKKIKGTILPIDTVVFAKIGEAVKLNRRAITTQNCLIDNNVMGIYPNQETISLQYFYYYISNIKLEKFAEATTIPSVKKSIVEKLEIPLPQYEEQIRISTLLDNINNLISLRRQQIEKLDELVKARFVELFGNLVIGDKVDTNKKKIGEIASVTKLAGFEFTKYIQYKEQGDIIMLRGLNCKKGHLVLDDIKWIDKETSDLLPRSKLYYGDILMTYAGTIGDVAMVDADDKYHLAPNVAKITLNDKKACNPVFLMHLFMYTNDYIMTFASVVAQASINMEKIRNFEYYFPPVELQNQFAAFVEQTDKSKLTIQQSLDKLEVLKKSLMQKYFG